MTIKKRTFAVIIFLALCLGAGLTFGGMEIAKKMEIGSVSVSYKEYASLEYMNKKYAKLEMLYQTIEKNFYKDVDEDMLETGMYKGLFAGLGDVYSSYMTKEEYEAWKAAALGEFEGIGVTFSQTDAGNFVILSVIGGSPAAEGGIKAGDVILKVDGKKYTDLETLGAAIRGTAGSKVVITYQRNKHKNTITLIREKIVTETVSYKLRNDKIGYIKISSFEENTAEDFSTALRDLEVRGAKGLIIDLRNDGGGLVNEGIEIADSLLGKGTITYLQARDGEKQFYYSDADKTELPYVLLVNGGTASTSEIVAAAIKDSKDGLVVGTTTFGKGIVQSTTQLSDGTAIKLTIKQYFSPLGHIIHKIGVKPDYIVKENSKIKGDEQLNKALALLQ